MTSKLGHRVQRLPKAVFAVSAVVLFACSQDVGKLMTEARQSHAKGDDSTASIHLKNVLQQQPDNAEARYLLGVIFLGIGDAPTAEKELRRALELGYGREAVLPELAKALLLQGQFKKVLAETAPSAEKPEKASAALLAARGNAYLGLGMAGEAREAYDQALATEPEFADALAGLARLTAAEDPAGAMKLVDRALAGHPKNSEAWLIKGDLHRRMREDDAALKAYGQAVQAQPSNARARIRRISALIQLRKFDAAQAEVDSLRKLYAQNPLTDYMQALLLFQQDKPGPALEAVQQVLRVAPDHMPSVLMAGLAQYSLGSLEQAERHLRQFIDKNPDSLVARKFLVSTLLRRGQGEVAVQALQPALKQAPEDPDVLALAGEAYMRVKQFALATKYLQKAAASVPNDSEIRARFAMSRLAVGDTEFAVRELESAARLDRSAAEADQLLIMTLIGNKEFDKALQAALKLQKKQPDNPISYDLLGGAYLGKNDLANARKSFERAVELQPDYIPAVAMLARLDLSADNPGAARKRYQAVLAKDAKNLEAMIGLAGVERATGNVKEYVAWLEKARAENPNALEPRILLGSYYLKAGDTRGALAAATEARTISPQHPDVLNLLGEAQSASGDKAGAVATYASLASVVPRSPLAHYRLAMAHLAARNFGPAEDALNRALALKPDYLDAQTALVVVEYAAGRYAESQKLAQQLQKRYPKLAAGYTLEGDALMAQRKFALAEAAFEKAFALSKSGPLATKLHAAASQGGKAAQANTRLLAWLREHPEDKESRLYLADALVKAHENKLAIEQYQAVLQKDPNNLLALSNLATLYRQGKDPRALEYFERSYKLKPDSAVIAHSLGWVLVEQGKTARGLELLRQAASQSPDNPEIRYHLAVALAKSGDKGQARKELERLLAGGNDFPQRGEAQLLLSRL